MLPQHPGLLRTLSEPEVKGRIPTQSPVDFLREYIRFMHTQMQLVLFSEGSEDNNAYGPIAVGHTQVSDKYLIPMYFGASSPSTLVPSLHIANVDTMDTTVDVKIGGVN